MEQAWNVVILLGQADCAFYHTPFYDSRSCLRNRGHMSELTEDNPGSNPGFATILQVTMGFLNTRSSKSRGQPQKQFIFLFISQRLVANLQERC